MGVAALALALSLRQELRLSRLSKAEVNGWIIGSKSRPPGNGTVVDVKVRLEDKGGHTDTVKSAHLEIPGLVTLNHAKYMHRVDRSVKSDRSRRFDPGDNAPLYILFTEELPVSLDSKTGTLFIEFVKAPTLEFPVTIGDPGLKS